MPEAPILAAALVSRFQEWLKTPDEFELYRANPLALAQAWKVPEREVADLLLVATRAGLFSMGWDMLCPGCGDMVESFDSLAFLHETFTCGICSREYKAEIDDTIEVSFTVSPEIRRIKSHDPLTLSAEDYYYRHILHPGGLMEPGRRYVDGIKPYVRVLTYLEPGEKKSFDLDLKPDLLTGFDGMNKTGFWFPVKGAIRKKVLEFKSVFRGGVFEPGGAELQPGPFRFEVENQDKKRATVFLFNIPDGVPMHPTQYLPFLTAKKLLNNQTFRELFRDQRVGGNTGLAARDMTILFTDLKASTALYERIGDVKAFSLVQQHFDILTRLIRAKNGALVKTIGDAVMASFNKPAEGLAAAKDMLHEIETFNKSRGSEELSLKIGLHRGPCIAVTLNDRVDYFGQTVNIAARIQALAEGGELCLSAEAAQDPEVQSRLSGLKTGPEEVSIRGLEGKRRILRTKLK